MDNISSRHELNLSKRVHTFKHASVKHMKEIIGSAGVDADRVSTPCDTFYAACTICAATGRPANMKRVPITHVNEDFSEQIEVDFVYARIHEEQYEVLHIVDLGIGTENES